MSKTMFLGLIIGAVAMIMFASSVLRTYAQLKDSGASGLAPGHCSGCAKDDAPGHGDKEFDSPGLEGLDSEIIGPDVLKK